MENGIKRLYEIVEKEKNSFNKIKELYNIKPDEIEGYIERNFEELRPALIKLFHFERIKNDFVPSIKNGFLGSSYDKEILNNIINVYSFEISYANPFYEVIKYKGRIISRYKTEPLKEIVDKIVKLSERIGITFLALLYGLQQNDKKLQPNLDALLHIFAADVEEKDDMLLLFEIYSDENKRKEFEEAFNEALKMMGKNE
jgi:hypothetical protein